MTLEPYSLVKLLTDRYQDRGVVAGAIGTILFWPRDSAQTTGARVVPSAGPHGGALQLHVGF